MYGPRPIRFNTGVFWQAVFQPPSPYSLFFQHGSSAKTLISHPHNTASYAGYNESRVNESDLTSLSQMVKKPTKGENILDPFITNTPYLWEKVNIFESAIRSDHKMVIACPRTSAKAKRSTIQFRDVREHRKFIWLI